LSHNCPFAEQRGYRTATPAKLNYRYPSLNFKDFSHVCSLLSIGALVLWSKSPYQRFNCVDAIPPRLSFVSDDRDGHDAAAVLQNAQHAPEFLSVHAPVSKIIRLSVNRVRHGSTVGNPIHFLTSLEITEVNDGRYDAAYITHNCAPAA
jgi:hypothetical protein